LKDVLIADGIGVALLVGGLATENADVAALGVTSLVLATPIVHTAKGHPGRGLLSLTLRIGLPLAGSIIAFDSAADDVLVGGMLGGFAATGIDLLISHYGHHEEPTKVAPAVGRSWSGDGTTTYGLTGRF
jgi:hypothetical protein